MSDGSLSASPPARPTLADVARVPVTVVPPTLRETPTPWR